jgi:CheY-like chemotaxis protein
MSLILLVDDDEPFRTMLRKMLVKMGYDVVEARNGLEGIRIFELQAFDLVMTDLVMPEKEGLETIKAMRQSRPGALILAMSGGGRGSAIDYLRVAKMLGADCILSKPFSNDELSTALGGLLPTPTE